jgi:hypothetical protein
LSNQPKISGPVGPSEPTDDMIYQAEVIAMTIRNAMEDIHEHISDETMAKINPIVRNGALTALHALYADDPGTVDWVAFQRLIKPTYWETPELLPEYVDYLASKQG